MEDEDLEEAIQRIAFMVTGSRGEIPVKFHRTFEEKPFSMCDLCGRDLLEEKTTYQIAKFYQGDGLAQELAICWECRGRARGGYSEDSEEAMSAVFSKELKNERLIWVSGLESDRVERMTASCVLCEARKDEVDAYFEYALCVGVKFVYHVHPFMVCGRCAIDVFESLSTETKRMRERFYGRYFGLPPTGGVTVEQEFLRKIMV